MKKEEIIYNINDEQELDDIFSKVKKTSQKETQNIGIIGIILTFVICIIFGCLIVYNNNLTSAEQTNFTNIMFLSILFICIVLAVFFYFYRKYKYNLFYGRTTMVIPINSNINNIVIDEMLHDLYYKKIENDIYYAYKTKSLISTSSLNRYLSYKIEENKLIIQVWKKYGKNEVPLNYGIIDRFINMACLYDLKAIIINLSKTNQNNINSSNLNNSYNVQNNNSNMEENKTNKNAIYSIVISCVSIFVIWWLSFIGISTGVLALKEIKNKNEKGKWLAIAGIVIGVIAFILNFYNDMK